MLIRCHFRACKALHGRQSDSCKGCYYVYLYSPYIPRFKAVASRRGGGKKGEVKSEWGRERKGQDLAPKWDPPMPIDPLICQWRDRAKTGEKVGKGFREKKLKNLGNV